MFCTRSKIHSYKTALPGVTVYSVYEVYMFRIYSEEDILNQGTNTDQVVA